MHGHRIPTQDRMEHRDSPMPLGCRSPLRRDRQRIRHSSRWVMCCRLQRPVPRYTLSPGRQGRGCSSSPLSPFRKGCIGCSRPSSSPLFSIPFAISPLPPPSPSPRRSDRNRHSTTPSCILVDGDSSMIPVPHSCGSWTVVIVLFFVPSLPLPIALAGMRMRVRTRRVLGATPKPVPFAPRGTLTLLPAIFSFSATSTFGKFAGIGFPSSAEHISTLPDTASGFVLSTRVPHDNAGPILDLLWKFLWSLVLTSASVIGRSRGGRRNLRTRGFKGEPLDKREDVRLPERRLLGSSRWASDARVSRGRRLRR